MRTTVAIDDELLAAARRRAQARDETLGQVIEDALRRDLARPSQARRAPAIPVFRGSGGVRPGIDLTSNRGLYEVLDEGFDLDQLR